MNTKLSCREAAKELLANIDRQDLSDEELNALAVHLSKCEACRRVKAQGEFMRRAFSAWRVQSGTNAAAPLQSGAAASAAADGPDVIQREAMLEKRVRL